MPAATFAQSSTPISSISSMATNNCTTAVQSGPYTKAQFQSTIEGSRTIKSSKEVEQLLRDYPAALELYRTGKYKVKVKCETDVERVILVEKRSTKGSSNPSTKAASNDTEENNQTVPDHSTNTEQDKEVKNEENTRRSRSRTHSQDRVAPTSSTTNGNNIVHTTISSIRMTSNTQPKVDHHRTPSKDRDVSVTPQQKQPVHGRSHSRDSQTKAPYSQHQGKSINREFPKMMVPFIPNANTSGNLWQKQRPLQPYFSNPLLQPQQRPNLYIPPPFVPQKNPLYQQSCYQGQRPAVPFAYQQQLSAYSTTPSIRSIGNGSLRLPNNYSSSCRSVSNTMGLPPSFRTFHSNQQQIPPFRPMYKPQVPFRMNHPWSKMADEPTSALTNNNGIYVGQQQSARHRAHSVDVGPRNNSSVRSFNAPQQSAIVMDHYQRHRPQPANNVAPTTENGKEQNVSAKEPTNVVNCEKLTVRQLNEAFTRADPSGRLPYSSIPAVLQRFGIALAENEITSAARELEYNVNEPISTRRLVHILVKLGKITKSTQAPRQPASPSMLPEDREVTDIMTQRKATAVHTNSSTQPNQWH